MKKLIQIRVVQFFLYEKREIAVGLNCGIFGANGSGKSSLLDAVQIVMLGANASRGSSGVSFNAQADESGHNTRSIRSYCLGQFGDASDARVRDHATTYITLVWLDSATKEVVSTGVCLAASGDRDGHDVLGRYIVPVELSLNDHLETVDGRERPKSWATFRQMLQHRAPDEQEPLYFDSERFVNAMLFRLRGVRGAPRLDAFRQAFRFGLRMKFDKSVDEIVRQQVLEARPTNIKRFKEVLQTFQEMSALVRSVQAKLDEAERIEADFADAYRRHSHSVTWTGLARDAQAGLANEIAGRAEQDERDAAQKVQEAQAAASGARQRVEEADGHAKECATRRDKHASHADTQSLGDQLKSAQLRLTQDRAGFHRNVSRLGQAIEQQVPGKLISRCADAVQAACSDIAVFLDGSASGGRVVAESAIRKGLRAAKLFSNELLTELQAIAGEQNDLTQEKSRLEENQGRLAKGKPPLDDATAKLKRELADQGVSATPVCDLVRVDDPEWQPTIESYLGTTNMQALLVDGDDERKAFGIYRRARIYEAKVVQPSRFADRTSPAAGTVAELISGSDAVAVNYLRSKFGQARRAETEDECFSHRVAMTKDGMRLADGEIVRKRPTDPANFKIGPVSTATRSSIAEAIRRVEGRLRDLAIAYDQVKKIFDRLGPYVGSDSDKLQEFMEAYDLIEADASALQVMKGKLDALNTTEYQALVEAAKEAESVLAAARTTELEAGRVVGSANTKHDQARANTIACLEQAERAKERAQAARAQDYFDGEFASEQWNKLVSRGDGYKAIAEECDRRSRSAESDSQSRANAGMRKLVEFLTKHSEFVSGEVQEDWRRSRAWLAERTVVLRDTGLREYKARMDDALLTARSTFRNDVAVALNEHFEWLSDAIDRMNEALRAAPTFSNGERYQFRRPVRPAYAALHKFIKDVAQFGPADDLLGGAGELPKEFEELMREKTEVGAASVKSPLDDYREFFDFDIEVYREDRTTGAAKHVGWLSKRVGSGSGGEHRSPLYVIAGAAIASAYRLDRGDDSGMRLLVIDEAFIKMDPRNIVATMRYFEELGLQIFMASTGDALGTLTAFLDRYYDIMRDADSNVVVLEGHDIESSVRDMFRADLPEFHPELVDEEILRQSGRASNDGQARQA